MRVLKAAVAAILLGFAALVQALSPIPSPTGYVTDQTGVIEPATMVQIQMQLAKYEIATGRKLAVLLVPATPDEELEAYADRVLEAWKIGETKGGGALLLWTAEGYVLIRSVGPALDLLAGEVQSDILSRWVVPEFAAGRGGTGIRNGVERMIAVLDGEPVGFPLGAATEVVMQEPELGLPGASVLTLAPDAHETSDLQMPPSLYETLPQEVEQLVRNVASDPAQGINVWFAEAGTQLGQLDVLFRALVLQLKGETVEPPFATAQITAYFVLLGALALAAIMFLRGALVAGFLVFGFVCGAALWMATGFTALAAVLFALGLLSPIIVPLLRALLKRADDSERKPEPTHPLLMPKPTRPTPDSVRAGLAARGGARTALPASRSAGLPPELQLRLQRMEPVLREVVQLTLVELRRLRWTHGVALFIAFIVAPVLFILVVLGIVIYISYRNGVAYLLADRIRDPQLKARLKAQLPRPSSAPEE